MARTLLVAALAVLLAFAGLVSANTQLFPERLRNGRAYREALMHEKAHHLRAGFTPNITKNWVAMPIDHQDPSKGTFQDKFYYDTQYWNGTGPCIFYLNGEGPLGASVGGYMADIAKAIGACTLSIEHRWYGESLPAALTDKTLLTSTLTVDQAMQDVAFLMNYFESNIVGRSLTWVLIGGSYSGGMTVWLNEKYPGKFKASWAASGVVYATFAYTEYDGHVKAVTGRDCGDALKYIMEVAGIWWQEGGAKRAELQQLFNIPTYNTLEDFMWGMADASATSVQYGRRTDMCNAILPLEMADPRKMLQKYAAMVADEWGADFMASCYYSTACLANKSMSAQWGPAGYSWIYECCNEMAWWQIGYPGSIRNINVSTSYFVDQCRSAFYNTTTPDSWAFNTRHHGRHPQTQGYIVATQGSDDPWSTTGLSVNQGPTFPVNTAQCTNCGHCGSMMSPRADDPAPLVAQRQLVLASLQTWLARP